MDAFHIGMDRGTESPFEAEPQSYMSKTCWGGIQSYPFLSITQQEQQESWKQHWPHCQVHSQREMSQAERRGTACQLHTATEKKGVERSSRKLREWVISRSSSGSLGSAWSYSTHALQVSASFTLSHIWTCFLYLSALSFVRPIQGGT